MNTFIGGSIFHDEYHNYRMGSTVCANFALGYVGVADDFFLVGAQPDEESPYVPLLTGNIIDSEGNMLCRIVRNVVTINPGDCSRVMGGFESFEIVDSARTPVITVRTAFEGEGDAVTTISGVLYDRRGRVVFRSFPADRTSATSQMMETPRDHDAFELGDVPSVIGVSGNGAVGITTTDDQSLLDAARVSILSRGAVHEVIRGEISDRTIEMDGKAFIDAELRRCTLIIRSGDFIVHGASFYERDFHCEDRAANIHAILQGILGRDFPDP